MVRRKERDRGVTPVIGFGGRTVLRVELKNGQQLNSGNAELLQIGNLLDQAGICAAQILAKAGTGMTREAANVHFIDDGSGGRMAEGRVTFPIVSGGIHDNTLHCRGAVVAGSVRRPAVVIFWDDDTAAIRVKKDFGWIETHAVCGSERPLNSIGVELTGLNRIDERVPVVIGAVGGRVEMNDAGGVWVVFSIKEEQVHAYGIPREQAEVDAAIDNGCANGRALASGDGRLFDFGARSFLLRELRVGGRD